MTESPPNQSFTRNQILALVGLTLFAALMRLYKLDEWALWVDEAHTFRDITSHPDDFWESHVSRYPLSYLMLRGLVDYFPAATEGWLRLPFAFFGILSIPVLAMVGRSIVGTRAAVVGALLLAVSPWHLYWSQNVRSYPVMLFFALLSATAFYSATRKRSFALLVLSMLGTLVAGLLHPSGYMPFAAFCAYGVFFVRRLAREGNQFAQYLPWIGAVVLAILAVILYPNLEYFQRAKPDVSMTHFTTTFVFFVGIPLGLAAIGGALLLWREDRRSAGFVGTWAFLPPIVLAVTAATLFKVTAQYCLASLPAFCLLAGVLTIRLTDVIQMAPAPRLALRVIVPAILVLHMLGQCVLYFQYNHGDRPKWRDAAKFVEQRAEGPIYMLTTNEPGMKYYLSPERFWGQPEHKDLKILSIEPWLITDENGVEGYMVEHVLAARQRKAVIYTILTEPELMEKDRSGALDRWLRENGKQVLRLKGWTGPKDMTVFVYEVDPAAAHPTLVRGLYARIEVGARRQGVERMLGAPLNPEALPGEMVWYLPPPELSAIESPWGPGSIGVRYVDGKVVEAVLNPQVQ